jgi:putative ABC transport system permease protein
MLLMMVMGMAGIYRGLLEDATLLIERIGADLWVVQRDTRGPFAELSQVPMTLVYRVQAVPGVQSAREFVFHTIQRQRDGKPLRIAILGLSWPLDKGEWLPLIAGRSLAQNHYEMVADKTLGLRLGERIKLGKDTYTIVGITGGMVSTNGEGMAFVTVLDSQKIQFDTPPEAIRLERAARQRRSAADDLFLSQPILTEQLSRSAPELPAVAAPRLSAVVVRVALGADSAAVMAIISEWADVSVFTRVGEEDLLVQGMVDKARRILGMFRMLLTVIAGIIMALILYTLTLDKLHSIALLKLQLAVIVLGISVLSSLLGIWKALRVEPNEALMG